LSSARRGGGLAALAVAAGLLVAAPGHAHTRSRSHSSWTLDETGARVVLQLPRLELTRVGVADAPRPGAADPLGDLFAARLVAASAAGACVPEARPVATSAPEGWAGFAWRVECPGGPPVRIESALLAEEAPSHLHFARVRLADGRVVERVLSLAEPHFELPGRGGGHGGTSLGGYVLLGIEHIATGFDHIAFVIALILLAARLGEVATLVTGFTVAHSVTLALAVLGVVRPEASAVEALIGFSIALVAAENAWLMGGRPRALPLGLTALLVALAGLAWHGALGAPPLALLGLALFTGSHFGLLGRVRRAGPLRALVAFGFGLVHGFGFAGVLAELELPRERLVPALLGFNVGVELGQLAVVAAVWPCLRLVARWRGQPGLRLVAESGTAAVAALGSFWFFARLFG
jgi:hypothetical protein